MQGFLIKIIGLIIQELIQGIQYLFGFKKMQVGSNHRNSISFDPVIIVIMPIGHFSGIHIINNKWESFEGYGMRRLLCIINKPAQPGKLCSII